MQTGLWRRRSAWRSRKTTAGRKSLWNVLGCRRAQVATWPRPVGTNRWTSLPTCSSNRGRHERSREMKKFVFLHYGFEKPTPEIMAAWGKWFESMRDNIIDAGGNFSRGREISKAGTKDLPRGPESITGFTIMSADSLDDAVKMAQSSPHIPSIRVYEVMSK